MSNQYGWEKLSLEQLQELIGVGINSPSLHSAFETRLLMRRLPELDYHVARQLITSERDPGGSDQADAIGHELARVLTAAMPFDKDLIEIRSMLSPGGQKVFDRAERRYKKSTPFLTTEINALEMLQSLDGIKDDQTGEKAAKKMEEFAEEMTDDEADHYRRHLAEHYDIHSAQDWRRWEDAQRCIKETRPELMWESGISAARKFHSAVRKLVDESKKAVGNWMPSDIIEYRKSMEMVRSRRCNPGSIITKPDGSRIYGNGEPVRISQKTGEPRRTSFDLFGNEYAKGDEPDQEKLRKMAELAFQKPLNRNR